MTEPELSLLRRYGKENIRFEEGGRYYIRTLATSGRYVWHFMGVAR